MNRYKFLVLFMISALALYAGESEKLFKKSADIWKNSGIKEYFIKVNYSAFSPLSGEWELNVKDGKIYRCRFNGEQTDKYNKSASIFTMEGMYKTAEKRSLECGDNPFIFKMTYDENGFIKSIAKIRNPKYKKRVKKDTSFKIEVLDFIPEGS